MQLKPFKHDSETTQKCNFRSIMMYISLTHLCFKLNNHNESLLAPPPNYKNYSLFPMFTFTSQFLISR